MIYKALLAAMAVFFIALPDDKQEVSDLCRLVGSSIPMPSVPCSFEDPYMAICIGGCYGNYVDAVEFYRQDACDQQVAAGRAYVACMNGAGEWYTWCLNIQASPPYCLDVYEFMQQECIDNYNYAVYTAAADLEANLIQALADFNTCAQWCCNNI